METASHNLSQFQFRIPELEKTTYKLNLTEVFSERKGSYLNELNLFLAYFNYIPNFIHEINIDCKAANLWFLHEFKTEIKDIIRDSALTDPLIFRHSFIHLKSPKILLGLFKLTSIKMFFNSYSQGYNICRKEGAVGAESPIHEC